MSQLSRDIWKIFYRLVLFSIFILLPIIGELLCLVKFVTSDFEPDYKREIIYGVSLVTGLGCVVGYIDIPDRK